MFILIINKNFTAVINRDSSEIRTRDHYIKSVMLYLLSYGIIKKTNGNFTTAVSIMTTNKRMEHLTITRKIAVVIILF